MCGNHSSNKGGMTSVISQIINNNWTDKNIKIKFIPTYYPGNNLTKMLYFCFSYIRILFNFIFLKPDIVHMHMSYKGSFTRKNYIHKLCKRFNINDVVHLHGGYFEEWYENSNDKLKRQIRQLLAECSCCIVLGEYWEGVVKRLAPKAEVVIIRNAIKIPLHTVKWNNEQCKLLFIGVLVPVKHIEDLLMAVKILKSSNLWNEKKLLIMGTGVEEKKLKACCAEFDIENEVEFLGWVSGDEKNNIIRNCQISVLSSYNEALPLSILESISYGMPVVATDVGDIASAVHNGENGYLVKPGDVNGIAEYLNKIMGNKYLWSKLSENSRMIAEKMFSDDVFFEKLYRIYSNTKHKI